MRTIYGLLIIILFIFSCTSKTDKLFSIHQGPEVGIEFKNTIITSDTFNAMTYEYIYNGSGVGVGDFNNDGLPDVFMGSNQVSCGLYLNQGNLKFKDVTAASGVTTDRWVTGVSIIDINADGLQDIYLCVAGLLEGDKRRNLLFINNGSKDGVPTFTESAKRYGLDDDGYCTMAAFFDYDKDNDLDLYLLNNWLESYNRGNVLPRRINGEAKSTDKLFKNNGDGTFSNVSRDAGILIEGYGLGVNICDINQDAWPDVYVANDFLSNDLIWVNQHDGTFKNMAKEYLKHQTHSGMGVDIADFNNDTYPDIMEVDMLPPDNKGLKMLVAGQNYDNFHMALKLGYEPEYMRNTLQLNRGKFNDGKVLFSDVSFMAGVARTDWSWAPLFADFDNDGWKDIFVGNGYRKNITNLDFVFFTMEGSPFGSPEAKTKRYWELLEQLKDTKVSNYVFRNTGTLKFEDATKEWGIDLPGFTNGAAYADFDNDGDLDLITNNIDQSVVLYENNQNTRLDKNHFIRFVPEDVNDINQKVRIYSNGQTQFQEITPYRGYESTVACYAHFGVGKETTIDSAIIEWPDTKVLRFKNLIVDSIIEFSKKNAVDATPVKQIDNDKFYFERYSPLAYKHKETSAADIKVTRTLLHELSRFGPCMASADVNNDGLDDIFIGGEVTKLSQLFIQQPDGNFSAKNITADSMREDGGALFFDADNDHDLDLYVAGACPTITMGASAHLLYLNDGKGNFTASNNLPAITTSGSCIESSDFDSDGDLDLFVGGRIKTNEYPFPATSYILRNDNGKFLDVTQSINPEISGIGLVSTAAWADLNKDGKPDLIVAGEWMAIRAFLNDGKKLNDATAKLGLEKMTGWWNCIKAQDLNGDGYPEIIAGNVGRNTFFQATPQEPVRIVAKDFDKNGSIDPIVTYYNIVDAERFAVHNRILLIEQIPPLKKRFETFESYASASFDKTLKSDELTGAYEREASTLSSTVLVNKKGDSFESIELPEIAQLSVINDIVVSDLDKDGHEDLILIGNNYAQETLFGRYDASIGTVLLGDGNFHWKNYEPNSGRLIADGDAKFIRSIKTKEGSSFAVVNNNDAITFFKLKEKK